MTLYAVTFTDAKGKPWTASVYANTPQEAEEIVRGQYAWGISFFVRLVA